MFNKEQNEAIMVNANIDMVFSAIINGVNYLSGFTVKQADQQNYTIYISKGISLFTWGENIVVTLTVDPNSGQTVVNFSSDSKLGTEIAAKSQNRKNIKKIVEAMNTNLLHQKIYLSQQMGVNPQTQTQPPMNNNVQVQTPMTDQMQGQPMSNSGMQPVVNQNMNQNTMYGQQMEVNPQTQMSQPPMDNIQQVDNVQNEPPQIVSTQHQGDALSDNLNKM